LEAAHKADMKAHRAVVGRLEAQLVKSEAKAEKTQVSLTWHCDYNTEAGKKIEELEAENKSLKDRRVAANFWFDTAAKAKGRISELETQLAEARAKVAAYKEDLIDALQDVVEFAPECTSSKEYAERSLKELRA
ncbi:MAG: hypothetical protein HGA87_03320, partial [Desulfobulbaceae bacterium]|nr:hypothetical protein [Desulfobulbaceae bacterium]